jgi:hypothetical protein
MVGETSPWPKKLNFFFDSQGLVHKEFVPEGKTLNAELYKGARDRLLKRIQRVCPAAFCFRDLFLLHDNAPTHKAVRFCQFLTQMYVIALYHPPYSPYLPPPDYFLFPKLKMKLKGLNSADIVEIQVSVTDELKKVQKDEFSAAFQKLNDCARAFIHVNGA